MVNTKDNQIIADRNDDFDLSVMIMIGDREYQEDSFGYFLAEGSCLCVVCDGMGGSDKGEIASALSVRTFIEDGNIEDNKPYEYLYNKTIKANELICNLKDDAGNPIHSGTTLVSVYMNKNELYWSSVGDSRAYLLRNNNFVQITQDQNYKTVLKDQLSAALISEEEYKEYLKNGEALISYLGIGEELLIDSNSNPLKLNENDMVVLMSDGLYKLIPERDIFRIISSCRTLDDAVRKIELKARHIQKKSNTTISRDNMTVAIIRKINIKGNCYESC